MPDRENCTHCGNSGAGEYSLVFEGESEPKEMAMVLCDDCVDVFLDDPDIRRAR